MKIKTKTPLLSFFFFMFFYCVFHSHTYSQSLKSELLNTDSIRMETTINSIHDLQKRYNYTSLNVYKAGKHYTLSTNQSIYGFISGIIATKLATNKNNFIVSLGNKNSRQMSISKLAIPFGILTVTCSISSLYNKITGNRYLINSRYSEYYENKEQTPTP